MTTNAATLGGEDSTRLHRRWDTAERAGEAVEANLCEPRILPC